MKIALLGLHKSSNLGDPLIAQTVEKLVCGVVGTEIEFLELDLNPKLYFALSSKSIKNRAIILLYKCICRLLRKIPTNYFLYDINITLLSLVYDGIIKDADYGIIAGGGVIHWRFHDYATPISAFIKACGRKNIPVLVNAVGIEGYNENSKRCRAFSRYLQYDIVKMITTRDDKKTLEETYLRGNLMNSFGEVADPAILCSKVFDIQSNVNSCIVGVGLIRSTILQSYNVPFSKESLIDYYVGVIRGLLEKNIAFELFTNGTSSDLDMVTVLEQRLSMQLNVVVPTTTRNLIETIGRYKAIVTARMHSCIIAYSLGIPAIAFNWCEKLYFWGKKIDKQQCYIPMERLSSKYALDILFQEMNKPYDENVRNELELKYLKTIRTFFDKDHI